MRKIEANDWWPDMVRLKDDLSLRELAERFGVSAGAVMAAFRRNGIERTPAPPGPRRRRRSAKSPAAPVDLPPEPGDDLPAGASGSEGRTDSRTTGRSKVEPFADLVGTVPDRVVAEKAGVSVGAVGGWRRARDIPAFGSTNTRSIGRAAPSRVSAVAPPNLKQPSGTHAWRVVLRGGSTGVVLASSLVEAATLAERAGVAISVELIGAVL